MLKPYLYPVLWWCVGRQGKGDQDVARLVLTGFGISVSELFGVISEDSRCCV